ncbi:hypothetical protein [Streptosporangium nondiastaticum]|uniref:hypothetical protein n=1 Tax=Streptosporangium nondiastaticum TaxID=35764 RepID=UPI0011B2A087|nr:hypothetical protein [Streptosporangium nondiastaticum]
MRGAPAGWPGHRTVTGISADLPNPFGAYRWALVDPDQELLAQLPVVDLLQGAVNGAVEQIDVAGYLG